MGTTTTREEAGRQDSPRKPGRPMRPIVRKRPIIGRSRPTTASAAGKPLGVVFVSARAPFMSVVSRAVKVLDRGPGGAKWSATTVPSLAERIRQLPDAADRDRDRHLLLRQREVLLLATGHATSKLVLVAAWFRRQAGYEVTVRTRWSSTVDDIFAGAAAADADMGMGMGVDMDMDMDMDGHDDADAQAFHKTSRLRNVSCLEVGVRLK